MPRASTRQSTSGSSTKKVHTLPEPTALVNKGKIELPPPPARFGSTGRSNQAAIFSNIIYFAGQHAEDLSQDIKGQTEQILKTLDKLLAESKSDKTKLVRADIFLKDKSMFKEMNQVWEKWVDPKYAPPCSTVVVSDFIKGKVLVEIVIIANISKDYGEAEKEGEAGLEAEEEEEAARKEEEEDEAEE